MVMLMYACKKDEQQFVYDKINDLTIENTSTTFTVAALDDLIITPKLIESQPEGETYDYAWTISTAAIPTMGTDVISREKDLKFKVELSPGKYTFIFKATSKKTGIAALSRYTVTVNGAFYGGWYVVGNKDGKLDLSLIRTDDVIFNNPIETVNKKSYPGKALSAYYQSDLGLIYFFSDQGAYRFNGNDLLELTNTSGTLPGFTSLPFKTAPYYQVSFVDVFPNITDQWIVADGGLYAGIGPLFYPNEVLKPFSERLSGDYDLFPGVFPASLSVIYFYDNKNKKFMQTTYGGRDIGNATATSTSFNMADVGKTMIAFDRGVIATHEYYYIMENTTGRYLMSTVGASPGINLLIANSPEINIAKNFATSSITKQLYYTVDNKIYLYEITTNASRLIYSFPQGSLIKDIEMLRSSSKQLIVATNQGSTGEVYYFDIDAIGEFVDGTYTKKFGGFGEIVQVTPR